MSAHRLLACVLLATLQLACQSQQAARRDRQSLHRLFHEPPPRCDTVPQCVAIASREPEVFSLALKRMLVKPSLSTLVDGFDYQHERPTVTRRVQEQLWPLLHGVLKEAVANPSRGDVPPELMGRLFALAEHELRSPKPEPFPWGLELLKSLAKLPEGRALLVQRLFAGEDAMAIAASLVLLEQEPDPAREPAVSTRAIEVLWGCYLAQRTRGTYLPELESARQLPKLVTQTLQALPVFHSRVIAQVEADAERGTVYPSDFSLYNGFLYGRGLSCKEPRLRGVFLRFAAAGSADAVYSLLGCLEGMSTQEVAQVVALSRSSSKKVRVEIIPALGTLAREHVPAREALLEVLQRDEPERWGQPSIPSSRGLRHPGRSPWTGESARWPGGC
ncbi:hypothetical protein [Archangium sp. Cb G35]|uniref:hypothetical protein n=1 Tax=Archangium sp. Cb G35 TaxID=1920190 RepID=UPI0011614BBD|nr:hypothetical protein [Archangium sp. Cb G35]